jgi:hypothetical protein
MATDIVQDADFSVVVTQKDQARLADIDHCGVAGFGNITVQADTDPVLVEKNLEVCFEHVFSDVKAGRQRVTVGAGVEKG